MKVTIQQYGSSILALMVFALLLGVCVVFFERNGKHASVLGEFMDSSIKEHTMQGYPQHTFAFDVYRNQTLPEIYSYGRYEIRTGDYLPVSDCFYGKDKENREIPVKVERILNENGESHGTVYWNHTECFYFEQPGIYELLLKAEDENGKIQTIYTKIFVNEEIG